MNNNNTPYSLPPTDGELEGASILIANRGEIAIRIMKTARQMGIKTYALQTPQEPNAIYLSYAHEIIEVDEDTLPNNKTVFLNPQLIVALAKENHVKAIHPGYGFLSENPELPELCEKEGILFIGPNAELIKMMGDKNRARQLAIEAGIPVVEGSDHPIKTLEEATEQVKKIGYPVILKAIAGGGGKGMRVVYKAKELNSAYKMAVNEAKNAFNNGDILIERFVETPRHIEIQILADKHGNAVHLYERECSIQRNHQKLFEEAPSLALTDELRQKVANDALALTKLSGYFTLGTVEYLLDKNGQYYFMEMNTRIQVEHPITEAITGLDLVECQLRTAFGEKLWLQQSDIQKNGWAMEFRVNAEDVQAGFSPDFGIIDEMEFPADKNLRVDSGYQAESVIPGMYDSLVAKLIVSGADRNAVINSAKDILQTSKIEGIKTTIPFFKALLQNPDFVSGNIDTSFLNNMKELFFQENNEERAAALIALQFYLDKLEKTDTENISPDYAQPWISRMLSKMS